MNTPKMKSVSQVPLSYEVRSKKNCKDCLPAFGGLVFCKKHSPYHDLQHMSLRRWAYWWAVKNGRMIVVSVLPFLVKAVVVVAFAVAIIYALYIGLDKQELVACNQLKAYSQTYPQFYLTQSEKEMCDAHGVSIDAPVK